MEAAKKDADAAKAEAQRLRILAHEQQAIMDVMQAQQEVQDLQKEVACSKLRLQRERRRRVTVATLRTLKVQVSCSKVPQPPPEDQCSDADGNGDAQATEGAEEGAEEELDAEELRRQEEARLELSMKRARAQIELHVTVDEFRSEWKLEQLDFSWFQALDHSIRASFKLPLPQYEAFGFSELGESRVPTDDEKKKMQRTKEILAMKIGEEVLSDEDSDSEYELELLPLPRELPFTPVVVLQVACQRYIDSLLAQAQKRLSLADLLLVALRAFEMVPDPATTNEALEEHARQQRQQQEHFFGAHPERGVKRRFSFYARVCLTRV